MTGVSETTSIVVGTNTPEARAANLPVATPSNVEDTHIIEVPAGQPPYVGTPPLYLQPVLIAAVIALIGTLIALWMNNRFHNGRLTFEEGLAEKKFDYDVKLEERKFSNSVNMAKWQRESEYAEEQLALFYEAAAKVGAIRTPMSYTSDNEDRPGREEERESVRQARDAYYPVLKRINKESDFFNQFYAARYRSVALFGIEAEEPYKRVWNAIHRVRIAAQMLMREQFPVNDERVLENRNRMEGDILEGAEQEDRVLAELTSSITQAEELFRPIIIKAPLYKDES